jgi:hypothetical protein
MIETKEGMLEYWKEQQLPKGSVDNVHWLRHKCDEFFLTKGFRPMNYAHSDAFQTYFNEGKGSAIKVTFTRNFDDSLLGNENWIIASARGNDYLAPYNAVRDMGNLWGIRGLYFTDSDNSSQQDLEKSLELLIDNNLAYEI